MSDRKYYYSEIFNSIQGEGMYTGQWTLWLRFFMCNLQCNGFGQIDPTNPETYELPFESFDPKTVNRVEDLPVWSKGCDSSYTWAAKFKHLMGHKTAREITDTIRQYATSPSNPNGTFLHPVSKMTADMCFTGGEPLLRQSQQAIVDIFECFRYDNNLPRAITFETNGTQPLTESFENFLDNSSQCTVPVMFSVSPKLWTVSGEARNKAIRPDVVKQYYQLARLNNQRFHMPSGQLKFVVGSEDRQWDELTEVVDIFRQYGVDWPVYIMPVGAREEEQTATAGQVAARAYERGYNVSGRMHVYLFGNAIGT